MRQWYKMESNDVLIYDVIGEDMFGGVSSKNFIEDLSGMKGDINVRINTPGGDVFEGMAIYNGLLNYKDKVYTYVDGVAASMGSVIAMAGDTVTMAENSMMMIHNPWTISMGDAESFRHTAGVLDKVKASLISSYMRHTDLSESEVSALMDAETWMTGLEAKEKGFASNVTESVKMAALDPRYFRDFKNTPKELFDTPPKGTMVARRRLELIQ